MISEPQTQGLGLSTAMRDGDGGAELRRCLLPAVELESSESSVTYSKPELGARSGVLGMGGRVGDHISGGGSSVEIDLIISRSLRRGDFSDWEGSGLCCLWWAGLGSLPRVGEGLRKAFPD